MPSPRKMNIVDVANASLNNKNDYFVDVDRDMKDKGLGLAKAIEQKKDAYTLFIEKRDAANAEAIAKAMDIIQRAERETFESISSCASWFEEQATAALNPAPTPGS